MARPTIGVLKLLRLSAIAPVGVLLGLLLFQGLTRAGVINRPLTFSYRLDAAALARAERPGPGLRVLFIGNSFTYFNDMPAMLGKLVAAGPTPERPLLAVSYTPPGQELAQDVDNANVELLLHAVHWDVVVLQERSWRLSQEESAWRAGTEPYARTLNAEIRALGSRTAIYETWGYRFGQLPGDTFAAMQERLTRGNALLAIDLQASLIPVGRAFAAALIARPQTPLWNPDTAHPSLEGSYLAASMMYDALFAPSDPATSTYSGGLPAGEARFLRAIAHSTWLAHPTASPYSDWQAR
jgi:hypothetical protein